MPVTLKEQFFRNRFIPKKAVSGGHMRVVCQIRRKAAGRAGAAFSVLSFLQREMQSVFVFSDLYC